MIDAALMKDTAAYCRVDDCQESDFVDCCNAAECYLMASGCGTGEDRSPVWKIAFEALTLHYYDSRHDTTAKDALPLSLRLLINQLKAEGSLL